MGYTTDFEGEFKVDKPVDEDTYKLLRGLQETRRIKRSDLPEQYGIDGEFYYEEDNDISNKGKIVNYNTPPNTQPGLWMQWEIQEDKQTIEWDGNEKFYDYIEWIKYIIDRILAPRGYVLNGEVEWQGEDREDIGTIQVENNKVKVIEGRKAIPTICSKCGNSFEI